MFDHLDRNAVTFDCRTALTVDGEFNCGGNRPQLWAIRSSKHDPLICRSRLEAKMDIPTCEKSDPRGFGGLADRPLHSAQHPCSVLLLSSAN
jgi:hypothetical protein